MIEFDYGRYYWKNELIELRLATKDDWELHHNNYYDTQSRFYLDGMLELPPNKELCKDEWNKLITQHNRHMFIILDNDGLAVGCANINSMDERNGTFSTGVIIYDGEHGKGYATSALTILANYAFKERRFNKWNSGYIKGNDASEAMHDKLGFTIEGIIRESIFHNGTFWDEVLCGMTVEEFMDKYSLN